METFKHTLNDLFSQLGLPNSDDDIDKFIRINRPIPTHILLADAAFWDRSKSELLKEALLDDSDWSWAIEQLNSRLRI
jgi:uncharacterized protein DUF2789